MSETLKTSVEELRRKRAACPARIFLTGGTGFLGSHIAARLLEEGHELYLLARAKAGLPASRRVERLLDWFGLGRVERCRVRVVEGDIGEPGLGLSPSESAEIGESTDEVVHCASATSFSEKKRAETEAVNVAGIERVLDLAERSRAAIFHYVSTAYVAGKRDGICLEELTRPIAFSNVYEETKSQAEWLAAKRCREAGVRLAVYRPSIVYGDSRTGRSLIFNALYYPVRTALFLKNLFEADIRERGGEKAAEVGVRLEEGGSTFMPIRIEAEEGAGINLIPVDFFVSAFNAIRHDAPEGGIFHLVNGRLTKIEDVIGYGQKLFHIRGIEACPAAGIQGRQRNALEMLFDTYLKPYAPYLIDRRIFSAENARPILERRGIRCPEFTYEIFSRCMEFAVRSGWGAKLFPK